MNETLQPILQKFLDFFQQLYTNKFHNLEEIGTFLATHNLPESGKNRKYKQTNNE